MTGHDPGIIVWHPGETPHHHTQPPHLSLPYIPSTGQTVLISLVKHTEKRTDNTPDILASLSVNYKIKIKRGYIYIFFFHFGIKLTELVTSDIYHFTKTQINKDPFDNQKWSITSLKAHHWAVTVQVSAWSWSFIREAGYLHPTRVLVLHTLVWFTSTDVSSFCEASCSHPRPGCVVPAMIINNGQQ